MKRIQAACLEQTLRFFNRDETLAGEDARKAVAEEVETYRRRMERNHVRYQIVSEQTQEDGSVLLQVKKQYNGHEYGTYLD